MKNLLLALQLFASVVTSSVMPPDWSKDVFSEPQSMLLFSGYHGDLLVTTPTGSFAVPRPRGAILENSFPLPALAPAGDQVASAFRLPDDPENVVCHPSWPVKGPNRPSIYKSVLGIYSLHDRKWRIYGDFCFVGSAAFSPDGNLVAFKATSRPGDVRFPRTSSRDGLLILDLRTGQFEAIPDTASVIGNGQLSWAPDGKYLVVSETRIAEKIPGIIVQIKAGSWEKKDIAVGTNPSWSPKGNWIAYLGDWNRTCVIVHPDGTGSNILLDLRGRRGGWLFYSGVNWSSDEDGLLLNQEQFDGPNSQVIMTYLTGGSTTTKSKNGVPVVGRIAITARALIPRAKSDRVAAHGGSEI